MLLLLMMILSAAVDDNHDDAEQSQILFLVKVVTGYCLHLYSYRRGIAKVHWSMPG